MVVGRPWDVRRDGEDDEVAGGGAALTATVDDSSPSAISNCGHVELPFAVFLHEQHCTADIRPLLIEFPALIHARGTAAPSATTRMSTTDHFWAGNRSTGPFIHFWTICTYPE